MTTTKELKNEFRSIKNVKNTLFEMLGPQSDGFEESKLNLLLGLDSCGTILEEKQTYKNVASSPDIAIEDVSTADCNLSGQEPSKKFDDEKIFVNRSDQMQGDLKIKQSKLYEGGECYEYADKSPCSNPNPKSAFRSIDDYRVPSSYFPSKYPYNYSNNLDFNNSNFMNSDSLIEHGIVAPPSSLKHPKLNNNDPTGKYKYFNLNSNSFNHTSNNFQNNNFHNNNYVGANGKPLLFTSIKNNYKKERKNGSVNFHIYKTNQEMAKNYYMIHGDAPPDRNVTVSTNCSNTNSNVSSNNSISINTQGVKPEDIKTIELKKSKNSFIREESYLNFLLMAADSMQERGLISQDELNQLEISAYISNSLQNDEGREILNDSEIDENSSPINEISRKCENRACGVVASKKLGWSKVKISKTKNAWLCNHCFKAWKNNQYCFYCNVIYWDNTNNSNFLDNKSWIGCDYCEMWQHIQCEESKGFYSDLSQQIQDLNFKYICPHCRIKGDPKKTKKSKIHKKETNELLGNKIKPDSLDGKSRNSKKRTGDLKSHFHPGDPSGFAVSSLFNTNDNRDIYHDFYKISSLNDDRKR